MSFRREAHVPRGGPDGGDGGRGGDVVLVCDSSRRDLASVGRSRHFRGERGGHGQGKRRHGGSGEDLVLAVPAGTVVTDLDGGTVELLDDGQRVVAARGGSGGHGNKRFATATRQAPRFAERGLPGQSGWIELHLKLLADAGVVGQPNAGKSSLLARLTRAAPKVADYPFTTTEPVLGSIDFDDRQIVLADIPGLIEGAAEGAGLGHEFLAHVERCRLLVHLVDIAPLEGDPEAAYRAVRGELGSYGAGLADLPEIVVLSKRDLLPDGEVEKVVAEWHGRAGDGVVEVIAVSAATGAGLDYLRQAIAAALPEPEEAARGVSRAGVKGGWAASGMPRAAPAQFESEHRVYRPGEEEGFEVESLGDGRFRVTGRGIEMLIARHDLSNEEALAYIEQRLAEIGVIAELRRAGFEPGDAVLIADREFELDPG